MNYKNYTLRELLDTYLRCIMSGMMSINRSEVHEAIENKLGLNIIDDRSEYKEVSKIFANLDKEIGFIIGTNYDVTDLEKMSKKLAEKLRKYRKKEVIQCQ